jgi:hypothetical protein
VDEGGVLLEAGAAGVGVVDRLVELDLEVAIAGVLGACWPIRDTRSVRPARA